MLDSNQISFVEKVKESIANSNVSLRKDQLEKMALQFGITDQTEAKELSEYAVVEMARAIALSSKSTESKYYSIVSLYNKQPNLTHRSSKSSIYQQYSTPAPISFLAGAWCLDNESLGSVKRGGRFTKNHFMLPRDITGGYSSKGTTPQYPYPFVFEPSAGNGLLTIAFPPQNVWVNEIDTFRRSILENQPYFKITDKDSSVFSNFSAYTNTFDCVVTNPPFDKLPKDIIFNGTEFGILDHLMVAISLELMKPNGRAALIIGGHTEYDSQGRIKAGKNRKFISYLYKHFNVSDIINISGELYKKQGTQFDIRMILIDGKSDVKTNYPPLLQNLETEKQKTVTSFDELYNRIFPPIFTNPNDMSIQLLEAEAEALALELELTNTQLGMSEKYYINYQGIMRPCYVTNWYAGTNINYKETCEVMVYYGPGMKTKIKVQKDALRKKNLSGLGMPYIPVSESCNTMNVDVPDSMAYETQSALLKMKKAVGGNVTEWLTEKLKYKTEIELCSVLFGEQIDAVANAIYNFEQRGQGIIIGDQTGIGKGRQAAAIVRYGIVNGFVPVFMTEKINLFSDILRDMIDIKSKDFKPFIVNAKEDKTNMKDQDGNVIYSALEKAQQNDIINNPSKISKFDYVVCTYSQFNKNKVDENENVELDAKGNFLLTISPKAIFILDESHNAGGDSNIGRFMKMCIEKSIGTVFLSATFAKRPENMPLYAVKTSLRDANMTNEEFVEAFKTGGVALQEVVSSQLVQEGQMIRRERKIENLEVNYNTLTNQAIEHTAIADRITAIMRRIIKFEEDFINGEIDKLDTIIASTQGQVQKTKGTSKAGVSNSPYFSKLFNVINQMLFSIKTNEVVEHALVRLQEGKKVVIAFSSTMEAFLSETEPGEIVNADFSEVLKRGLQNTLRYSELDAEGKATHKYISLSSLSQEAQNEYNDILNDIRTASTGITASPIDVLKQRLSGAGYRVLEVTGRQKELRYNFTEDEAQAIQEKQAAKPNKKVKAKGTYPIAEALVPPIQYQTIIELARDSEEKDFFINKLNEIETKGQELKKRSLEKEANSWKKENKNSNQSYYKDIALPTFHFFNGSTDIYVYEWHEKDGLLYTYTILNGDVQNAEFGYQSIQDLHANYGFGRTFEMDFYFSPKPISEILNSGRFAGLGATATQKNTMALVMNRKKENVADAFRQFQNNECDVLLINQSGSTGASAHAVTTSKVKKEDVRQRCMIFLQAELDINRQVQKMGRVNRTGQIMPPIYDYLSSVIPAEQRLMMMLQKKLKSLDANTSSNQKNSSNLLDVPDFLNKYGDKVVYDYLVNNPEVNLLLGDVLEMKENESESKEPSSEKLANLSSKISGRVAVLSVKMQEHFYTSVFEDYNKYVKSLQQQGKYDLEMETKNFEAETLSRDLVYINPEPGLSVFSNHSYLEKVEVNNLVKPYSQYEVKELIERSLNGVEPINYSNDIINKMDIWADERRANIEIEQTEKFANLIKNIPQEKGYKKLAKAGADGVVLKGYIDDRTKVLEKGLRDSIDNEKTKIANQTGTFRRYFKFFYPGKSVNFPTATFENGASFSEAICVGVDIDFKKKNPFTPGNIYFSFAISDSNRHFDVNLANEGAIQIGMCMGNSFDITKNYLDNWTELCGKSNANRVIRYIITGNILQTIAKENYKQGRLVNYTLKGGGVGKGLIMPNKWQPNFEMGGGKTEVNITIPVPVFIAKDYIKQNASERLFLTTSDTLTFGRYGYNNEFSLNVPRSATQGAKFFKDTALLSLVKGENFNSRSQLMVALVEESQIDKVLKYLQDTHKLNVMVKKSDLDKISIPEGEIPDIQVQIPLPPAQAQKVIEKQLPQILIPANTLVYLTEDIRQYKKGKQVKVKYDYYENEEYVDVVTDGYVAERFKVLPNQISIDNPTTNTIDDTDELMLMELEAEALALELELLSLQGMNGYKDEFVVTNGRLYLTASFSKYKLTDNFEMVYTYDEQTAKNHIRIAESISEDDSKFYIKKYSEVSESLKGIKSQSKPLYNVGDIVNIGFKESNSDRRSTPYAAKILSITKKDGFNLSTYFEYEVEILEQLVDLPDFYQQKHFKKEIGEIHTNSEEFIIGYSKKSLKGVNEPIIVIAPIEPTPKAIKARKYDVTYQIDVDDETIEFEGILKPYHSGRSEEYKFEPTNYTTDESESYYDENWEDIEEQILTYFYANKKDIDKPGWLSTYLNKTINSKN